IAAAAKDPDPKAVDKIERLTALYLQLVDREKKEAFNQVLEACQLEMQPVARDCFNDPTKTFYPSLEAVARAIKPIHQKYRLGLSFTTLEPPNPDTVVVECRVFHRD